MSDITLLDQSNVPERLPQQTGIMGDAAYQGIARLHPLGRSPHKKPIRGELSNHQIAYNHAFSQRRIIVENIINPLHRYQCLTQMDRHHRHGHTTPFVLWLEWSIASCAIAWQCNLLPGLGDI